MKKVVNGYIYIYIGIRFTILRLIDLKIVSIILTLTQYCYLETKNTVNYLKLIQNIYISQNIIYMTLLTTTTSKYSLSRSTWL